MVVLGEAVGFVADGLDHVQDRREAVEPDRNPAGGRPEVGMGSSVARIVLHDAQTARELGAEQVIFYREEDVSEAIMAWTGGTGVDVVLDTVGSETFRSSLGAARVYGHVVTLLDLNFHHNPQWYGRAFRTWLELTTIPGLKKADHVAWMMSEGRLLPCWWVRDRVAFGRAMK